MLISWLGEIRTVAGMAWTAAAGLIVVAVGCRLGPGGIPEVTAGLSCSAAAAIAALHAEGGLCEQRIHSRKPEPGSRLGVREGGGVRPVPVRHGMTTLTWSGQVREQGVEGEFLLDANILARHGGR